MTIFGSQHIALLQKLKTATFGATILVLTSLTENRS